jgi:beta-phosphoglucomutase-like phosphatase (HAD superfamily)
MHLDIPPGEFAGYIFDCDGTLVDTMPLHYRAWCRALRLAGLSHDVNEDLFYTMGGVPTRRVAELLVAHYNLPADAGQVFHDKEQGFLALQPELRVVGPVVAFARRVALTHPVSVATGSPRPILDRTLALAGLAEIFTVRVTPEDVAQGKPAPEMFLLAAERMGVAPRDCLVFEDGAPGFAAAEAAGMQCVRVPSR